MGQLINPRVDVVYAIRRVECSGQAWTHEGGIPGWNRNPDEVSSVVAQPFGRSGLDVTVSPDANVAYEPFSE